ncbi:ComEC/Rec2 family competence protein [Paratractidigestivibacter sp.]|uniref:ComEC/Rec2 family competence protein n=1 Tax=Paratractidigestivibacter sp. TaxID=2847316 RepID=UPI002AC94789|nr:ComEC/Rec2 family competence protein [Paratractidigestivibacter sp.]
MSKLPPMPPRPAIPAAAYGLAGAIAVSQLILRAQGDWHGVAIAFACVTAFVAVAGIVMARGRLCALGPVLTIVSFVGLLSCGAASLAAARTEACGSALGSSAVSSWSFELVSDMTHGASSWRGRARAVGPDGEHGFVWVSCPEEFGRGETLRAVGRYKANAADDWGRSSAGQGICGTVSLVRVTRHELAAGLYGELLKLRLAVIESFCPEGKETPAGALMAGLVCGYSVPLKELGLDDDFAVCGASHLIAVSGSHLALVSSLLARAIKRTRLGKVARLVVLILATGVFVVFCGSPLSAVRSWLMSMAAGASELAGRRGHPLSAMSVMGCLIVLLDPSSTGQMGFLLSLLCVGGICLFGKYAEHQVMCLTSVDQPVLRAPEWARPHVRRIKNYMFQSVATSIVCQLASAPVCLPAFGKLSLIAPIANIALGALFSPLLGAGVIAAGCSLLPFGDFALSPATVLGSVFIQVIHLFAGVPLACVSVDCDATVCWAVFVACATLLLVFWPKARRRALLGFLSAIVVAMFVYLVHWRYFVPASICVMDVGQADAVLVRDGASSLMVDAGVDSAVATALARNHVLHLDAIVLTHLDDDHVGGLDDLVGVLSCDQVYVAKGVKKNIPSDLSVAIRKLTGKEATEISFGQALSIGAFKARAVWPEEPVQGDENADSVVLKVSYERAQGRLTALLTGDAESDQLEQVISSGAVGDIDFLKVGHHGSAASITEQEASVLLPEVAVASAGENNRYKHPRQECIDAVESAGALFLCTKDVGDVTVSPGLNGPQVKCTKRTLTTE